MTKTEEEKILEILRKIGSIRARDLKQYGLSRTALLRLYEKGMVNRPGRGLYVSTETDAREHQTLVEVTTLAPNATICLLSALRFHGLTTQEPHEVWIALPSKAWRPKIETVSLRVVRMSNAALSFGVESHVLAGVDVKVFSPAKTVADCFKFRSTIGMDVAIESLRDCWTQKKATADEIYEAAKVCRMSKVMLPYMEAIF
jgi:predicted transcriptional regulator of viral defense system